MPFPGRCCSSARFLVLFPGCCCYCWYWCCCCCSSLLFLVLFPGDCWCWCWCWQVAFMRHPAPSRPSTLHSLQPAQPAPSAHLEVGICTGLPGRDPTFSPSTQPTKQEQPAPHLEMGVQVSHGGPLLLDAFEVLPAEPRAGLGWCPCRRSLLGGLCSSSSSSGRWQRRCGQAAALRRSSSSSEAVKQQQ